MRTTIATMAMAAILFHASIAPAGEQAALPVCGDVNGTGTVSSGDALLVLKKGVSQPITLDCSAYDDRQSACEAAVDAVTADLLDCGSDLEQCQSAPVCGNGIVESGENCEAGNPGSATCVSLGFAGGTLACPAGCTFDNSGCYAARFDASGNTIVDHQTGLEWEKKDSDDATMDFSNPHDVDNSYTWSVNPPAADGPLFTDFLARLNGATDGVCYDSHCDWRIPTLEELETLSWPAGAEFQPGGQWAYWSASTDPAFPTNARILYTDVGEVEIIGKTFGNFARAVRSERLP